MKNYSWFLFVLSALLAPILSAHYDYIFTKMEDISEAQWGLYLEGAKTAYAKSMGPEIVSEVFPKVRAAGRDVLEMKKNGEYFGHIFINESQLPQEKIYRVGMFGLKQEQDFGEFSQKMMNALLDKYRGFDLACGSPSNSEKLIALIKGIGFQEDNSVAEAPETIMELYGIDTTEGRYKWFRFTNK